MVKLALPFNVGDKVIYIGKVSYDWLEPGMRVKVTNIARDHTSQGHYVTVERKGKTASGFHWRFEKP
jgi:hypothetical protein